MAHDLGSQLSKDKVFAFKMLVDLAGSGVDLVKRMQSGGNIENSWIMFDHVKYLQDWTTMAYHVYNNKHCKVLTIPCCDMQSEDARVYTILWERLNVVVLENGVPNFNFKAFKWIVPQQENQLNVTGCD